MFKLLIVDDEEYITDGLVALFHKKMDIELEIYKAYSAMEALDILDKVRIDVVLSDIHMPGMDGIQLLKKIKEQWPECRVILLTGYSEFDYVYSAIKYQGANYILKSESFDKIIQAVKDDLMYIEKRLKDKEILQKAEEQIKITQELLRKEYFTGIIKGIYSNKQIKQEELKNIGVDLNLERPVLMLIGKIDDMPKGDSYTRRTKLLYSVKLLTEQYLHPDIIYTQFVDDDSNLVWIIQPSNEQIEKNNNEIWQKIIKYIKGSLELVQTSSNEAVGISVSFVLDDDYVEWREIPDRYQLLKMFLNYRLGSGKGMLITDKRIMVRGREGNSNLSDGKININIRELETLRTSLDNGQKEEFIETLSSITDKLSNVTYLNYLPAQELYYNVALILFSYIKKWNIAEQVNSKIGLEKLMIATDHDSWFDAANYLKMVGEAIFDIQESEQDIRTQNIINKVKHYINDNIGNPDEINLTRISELVYLNQSYLSRLFKQVTGVNFSDYISEVRIKKAKELLKLSDMKIKDIAQAIGLSSATNFSRFFKKYTGVTPQEYKNSLINRNIFT